MGQAKAAQKETAGGEWRSFAVLAACLASGALMALSTPPWDLVPLPWVGLAVLAYLLAEERPPATRFRRLTAGALRGLLFGAGTNLVALRFVVPVVTRFTPLPWAAGLAALVLLALEQGLRFAAASVLTIQFARHGVPRWFAFGVGVYLSTFIPCVFPWTVAIGLVPFPPLLQMAEFVGERGVATLMAFSSALAVEGTRALLAPGPRRRGWLLLGAALGIPAFMLAQGLVASRRLEAERLRSPKARVALVQPSIEATERWDRAEAARILERLSDLTRSAEGEVPPPDLTVWTEGAYPYLVDARSRYDSHGAQSILQPGVRGPLLVGLMMRASGGAYNAATVVSGGRLAEPYFKSHLLIFGEYVPLGDTFPWLNEVFYRGTGLLAGKGQVRLDAGPIHAVALNCYEDTLSGAVRDAMAVHPNLLVNITNDAWYTGSMESELHLRLATPRAIEVRRDMVRAVNYGETTWVDAAGRVRGRYDSDRPGILLAEPALLETRTLYSRAGDTAWIALSLLAVGAFMWRGRKASASGASPPRASRASGPR